jgi:protocatechuate 3,4-dioxygenase beta subunit
VRRRLLVAFVVVAALAIVGFIAAWLVRPHAFLADKSGADDGRERSVQLDPAKVFASRRSAQRGAPGALVGAVRSFGADKPVAGVKVTIASGDVVVDATTRDDGSFAFVRVPAADDWTLSVANESLGEARLAGIVVVARQTTDVGVVYLAPKFGVPGAVVDERGRPIAGATVVVMERTPQARGDVLSMLRDLPRTVFPVLVTKTGADGSFRLAGLPPGTYVVVAKKPGYAGAIERAVTVAPDVSRSLRLQLEKGCRLAGRVVRADGGPVDGIPVVAFCFDEVTTLFETAQAAKVLVATDADGAFSLDGLRAGIWWVVAAPPGEAISCPPGVQVPKTAFLEIRLDGGATLSGRVTGTGGAPVADAEVSCDAGVTVAQALTDRDGRYELRGLAAGTAQRLGVRAAGYCSFGEWSMDPARRADAAFTLKPGANTRDVTLVAGGTVRGTVVEDGTTTPVAAATVSVLFSNSLVGAAPSSTTDAAGRFEVRGVPVGAAVIVARKPGWCQTGDDVLAKLQALRPWGVVADSSDVGSGAGLVVAKQGDVVERTIAMTRGVSLRGRVTGPDANPVAGARVAAEVQSFSGLATVLSEKAWGGASSSLTDADGRFEVAAPVGIGKVRVVATAPGFRSDREIDIEVGGATPPTDIELKLGVGGTIEGRVTDAAGAPVEGANVSWRRASDFPDNAMMQALIDLAATSEDRGRTTTGADGAYRLALVDPYGSITLEVHDARHVAAQINLVTVSEGKTSRQEVTLQSGLSITGRVSRSDGATPSNAWIEVHRVGFDGKGRDASGDESTTAPDGRFRVDGLESGKYQLIGHAAGAADGKPVVVDAGAEGVEIRLAALLAISGAVKFADGRPAVGAVVTTIPSERGKVLETRAGDDGAFRLDGLDPGDYELRAVAGPAVTDSAFVPRGVGEVAAGESDVAVVVEAGATISGTVLGLDGAPIAAGFVRCFADADRGDTSRRVTVAAIRDGRFVLKGLTPGKYVLSVDVRGLVAPQRTADAGATDADFRLTRGGAIKGRVLMPDGEPATGADVQIADEGDASARPPSDSTHYPDGDFSLACVLAGPHRVTAEATSEGVRYVGELRGVVVVDGKTTENVEIRLAKRE